MEKRDRACQELEGVIETDIGIVSRVYGVYYGILPMPGMRGEILGKLRGRLRLEKSRPEFQGYRHLVMVGDRVRYSVNEQEATIESLLPRENELLRVSGNEMHALGANIDRAALVVSLAHPSPKFAFVDRFLASCYAGGVEPLLIFTKTDLISDPESEVTMTAKLYGTIGYRIYFTNLHDILDNSFINILNEFSDGITLFAGNSGTGKSTLINRLLGEERQKTGSISVSTRKGRHTTTNSYLIPAPDGSHAFIDTPGVKEWGILHLNRADVINSYPELREAATRCRFRNCDHSEGVLGCRVQERITASIEGTNVTIDPIRIDNLRSLTESLVNPDRIRTGDYIKPTGRLRDG
jgi:ribosome biogenesis GTPase